MAGELSKLALEMLEAKNKTPFSMAGIDHVVLLVTDMKKAMHFYTQILPCRPGYSYPDIAMEQVWCGTELIVLLDISQPQGAYALPEVANGRNMDHVCLSITPCEPEVLKSYLEEHNVAIDREAVHGGARGMGHSTYVLDPFGNKLELKGPPLI